MSTETQPKCPQCGSLLPANALAGLCPNCLMALNFKTETAFVGEASALPRSPLPPAELAPHFPQLEVLECLGRGGMGVVYKARQKTLNRVVALKLLAPERVSDPKFAERFGREAQALARLNHPNIVTIHDHGQAGGFYYLLMEFVDGVNLGQLLQVSRVEPRETLAIVPQICDALQYAHDQGIVHRDIKPENILLDRRGRVKVADFGLAKIVGYDAALAPSDEESGAQPSEANPVLTDASRIMGTPQYMSPEQIHTPREVGPRADIYALGVVFYQMLTGELPGKKIEPPSKKVRIDVRLDEVVLRALETKPELRYPQVSLLKTQIETIADTSESAAAPAPRAPTGPGFEAASNIPRPARALFKSRFALAVTGLALLALLLGSVLLGIRGLTTFPQYWRNRATQDQPEKLAELPHLLRKLPTARVIAAGLAKPVSPWAWQELEKRPLSSAEVTQLMSGLTDWVKREHPVGRIEPLPWLERFLAHLAQRGLVSDDQRTRFVQAVQGEIRGVPSLRLREGREKLRLEAECRYRWHDLFDLVLMNEVKEATVDGQPVEARSDGNSRFWSNDDLRLTLGLPALAPGRYKVKLEVLSALVDKDDLTGLSPNAPSAEWPRPKLRWTRTFETELVIHPRQAVLVAQTQDPALDPLRTGTLSIKQVIIRPKGGQAQAVLQFSYTDKLPVDISFDVTLRVAGQTVSCGQLWVNRRPDFKGPASGTVDRTVDLARVAPEVRAAEIVLTPNPAPMEDIPTVDRIWGNEVVFSQVPLKRLDLADTVR